jgi:hypothetical protein
MCKVLFTCLAATAFCKNPDIAQISEAMGHLIGKNLEQLGVDFDLEAVVKGLKEESEGKSSPLNEDECVQAIVDLQEEKVSTAAESELEQADSLSNGDQIQDENGNHSLPASDPSKYR